MAGHFSPELVGGAVIRGFSAVGYGARHACWEDAVWFGKETLPNP